MTICQQWAWKPNDKLKSLKECIDLLVTNAGCDGNFMLNVGPDAQRRDRAPPGRTAAGDRPLDEAVWREHLRHPRRPVPAGQVGRQHLQGRRDLRPRAPLAGRRAAAACPPWQRRSSPAGSSAAERSR